MIKGLVNIRGWLYGFCWVIGCLCLDRGSLGVYRRKVYN